MAHRQRNGVMQLAYTRRRTILFLLYVQVARRHSVACVSGKVSCEQAIFWGIGRRETPKKARAQRLARTGTHAIPDFWHAQSFRLRKKAQKKQYCPVFPVP